ncbi:substrate-binding domain-containing protein [Rhizobium leguminosarum]
MRNLLKKHPDVAAIYNVEGGNAGMAKGSEEAGLAGRTRVVTHEENSITVPLMRDDVVQYVLAQDPAEMLRLAVNVALVKNATPQGAAPCRFWPPYAVQSAKICAGTAD